MGAGSAGCVLASRLSEAGADVLLLEAGCDTPPGAVPDDIQDTYPRSYYNRRYMWPDLTAFQLAARDAQPASFPQARVMGGGSSVTGMVALRGIPDDYDGWEADGARGWAWGAVLPAFRRVERDLDFDGPLHGNAGPIPVRRYGRDEWPPFARAIGGAAERAGFRAIDDLNADFGDAYGPLPLSNTAGGRASSASAYLDAGVRRRPNLTIRCETTVHGLRFERARCVGVTARRNFDGHLERFGARHVVLSAGAIHSPALLLRSGIGPQARLRALGLDVVLDAPGVGENLQNHPIVYLATHLRREARQGANPRTQFVSALRFSSDSQPGLRADMVMLVMTRSSWHRLGEGVVGLGVGLYRPLSRGRIQIISSDPTAQPIVRFDMLSRREDRDRMKSGLGLAVEFMLDKGVKALRHELFTAAYTGTVRRLNRRGVAPRLVADVLAALLDGPDPIRRSLLRYGIGGGAVAESRMRDESWLASEVVRRTFGMYHPAGTCRIGPATDADAVVNTDCTVHGAQGLSVVDASVMPTLIRGTTFLPVVMLAERVTEKLIRVG